MRNVTPASTRLRAGISAVFFLVGLVFAIWESRVLWHNFVSAIRASRSRR